MLKFQISFHKKNQKTSSFIKFACPFFCELLLRTSGATSMYFSPDVVLGRREGVPLKRIKLLLRIPITRLQTAQLLLMLIMKFLKKSL
jgi:hypothetical protein